MRNILLIKLGALGDVLRTTSLLRGIDRRWPESRVTWVAADNAVPLLVRNPMIAQIATVESLSGDPSRIANASWDVLINLDEDPRATRMAQDTAAREKYGIGRTDQGRLAPLSAEADRLVRLAGDDRLKFRENQEPFQAMIYQAIGLPWAGEPYVYVPPTDMADRQARLFLDIRDDKKVGLFVGASDRYANKFWSESEIAEFCRAHAANGRVDAGRVSTAGAPSVGVSGSAAPRPQVPASPTPAGAGRTPQLFLFGGPAERNRMERLQSAEPCRGIVRITVDSLDDLAAVVAACDLLICGDTLVMHLGQAMRVPQVVLFGPTAHTEIVVTGQKIVSPYSCGPCYLRTCAIWPSCMGAISPRQVLAAGRDLVGWRCQA